MRKAVRVLFAVSLLSAASAALGLSAAAESPRRGSVALTRAALSIPSSTSVRPAGREPGRRPAAGLRLEFTYPASAAVPAVPLRPADSADLHAAADGAPARGAYRLVPYLEREVREPFDSDRSMLTRTRDEERVTVRDFSGISLKTQF